MTDKEAIKASMGKYLSLTTAELEYFCTLLTFRDAKRGEAIHRAGKVCDKAFFIIEGCFRYYTVVDGEEVTGQFFFENSWYSDYESFLLNKPSKQTIETLEKTSIAILPKQTLYQLYVELPQFEKFGRLMAENAFVGLHKRTESLTHRSATERYLELSRERPKVIRRVAQKHIASYLSVKPQSLSRIRKTLSGK